MALGFTYKKPSREQVERLINRRSGGDFPSFIKNQYRLYTPKNGKNHIRILPNTWEDDDIDWNVSKESSSWYALPIAVHYGVGPDRASVLCLSRMRGQRCPLCEARRRAERENNEQEAKDLRPVERALMWVIDRLEAEKGLLVWAAPRTLEIDIAKAAVDNETGELYAFDNDKSGYDIFFDRSGEKMLVRYSGVTLARRPSSINQEQLDYAIEHKLPQVLHWRSYEEIATLYSGGIDEEPVKHRPSRPSEAEPPFNEDDNDESAVPPPPDDDAYGHQPPDDEMPPPPRRTRDMGGRTQELRSKFRDR